jgi:RHS repeat-associated protein
MHKDWLGSARIVSGTNNHTINSDMAFAPYGEIYAQFGSTGTAYQMFTGDIQDIVSGMMATPNREYNNSAQGRWISPDPAGAGWNLYAYAPNPNSSVDPSGLQAFTGMNGCLSICGYSSFELAGFSGGDGSCQSLGGCPFSSVSANVPSMTYLYANAASQALGALESSSLPDDLSASSSTQAESSAAHDGEGWGVPNGPDFVQAINRYHAGVNRFNQYASMISIYGMVVGEFEEGPESATLGISSADSTPATTFLYRAADETELQSIIDEQQFLPSPNGTDFKGFFKDYADASNFASRMSTLTGDNYTVVVGEASTPLVNAWPAHNAATEGPGVLVPNSQLSSVGVVYTPNP